MRVEIMILSLLLFADDSIMRKESGSRSTAAGGAVVIGLGNVSARERDFRWAASPSEATSVYRSADIAADDLIGGRVTSFAPDDFIWKKRRWRGPMPAAGEGKGKTARNGKVPGVEFFRDKRSSKLWIEADYGGSDSFLKMHAFVVRDEDISGCDVAAPKFTKTRYFMCSGVILTKNLVLTTASCMNHAEINVHYIDADLAVLIGALEKNSYVIKIANYKIHPLYEPDPDSSEHAKHNLAILTLSCSIPQELLVLPKLAFKTFQDVGHLCCPDRCRLLTVIENSQNHHLVRVLQIKHLPAPSHRKNNLVGDNDEKLSLQTTTKKNSPRLQDSETIAVIRQTRELESTSVLEPSSKEKTENTGTGRLNDCSKISETDYNVTSLFKDNTVYPDLNWKNINEDNGENITENVIFHFAVNSTTAMAAKLVDWIKESIKLNDTVLIRNLCYDSQMSDTELDKKNYQLIGIKLLELAINAFKISKDDRGNDDKNGWNKQKESTTTKTTDALTKSTSEGIQEDLASTSKMNIEITTEQSLTTPESELETASEEIETTEATTDYDNIEPKIFEKDATETEEDSVTENNVHCPPLGSPIVADDTLVGMIAYTCDDAQSWVSWKYVNINQNIRWIRKRLKSSTADNNFEQIKSYL